MAPCLVCGELLPHYCAAAVTIRRDRRRAWRCAVTITDRARPAVPGDSPGDTGWQPGMAVDVMALLDVCEAIDGPGWDREAAMGMDF